MSRLPRFIKSLQASGRLPNTDNLPWSAIAGSPIPRSLIARLADNSEKRRHIFSINPGRAGSGFLSELLATDKRVQSYHEPRPRMTGSWMVRALADLEGSREERRVKVSGINFLAAMRPARQIYAETSHMFCKSFHDVVLGAYSDVDVIILRRDIAETLKSFLDLGFFGSGDVAWPMWMHRPEEHGSFLRIPPDFVPRNATEQAILYLVDIEKRAQTLPSLYPEARFHAYRLEEIARPEGARRLFASLGLEWAEASDAATRRLVNRRSERKTGRVAVGLDECNVLISDFETRFAALGGEIPDLSLCRSLR